MEKDNKQKSLDNRFDCFEPLIITNEKANFITHGGHREPSKLSRELFLPLCPLTVIDKESLELIQVLQLHKAIDHTVSATGSAILLRSLVQPSTNLRYIRSKQDSLKEIASNDKLRQALNDFVHEFGQEESAIFKFLNKGLYALFPYLDFKRTRASVSKILKTTQNIPLAESSYLRQLISNIDSYKGSNTDQMMKGSIYKTFGGLKSGREVSLFTPKKKFIPNHFTKWIFAGPAVAMAPFILDQFGFGPVISPLMTIIGIVWTGLYVLHSLFVKPIRDTERFIEPFRKSCVFDPLFNRLVDTMGSIDELLSCHRFAGEFPNTTVLPKVFNKDHHFFEAAGLRSPVLSKHQRDIVPNNVFMKKTRLTFITGPNSGGKTTLCKSIAQNQLLAQIGSYVMAEKADIGIADKISYQAPKFDSLLDNEGRFGTELCRTRDIFFATSPRSLVILDELAEGTTYEERLNESSGILSDFCTIGNNTILVTHNHSLVDRFMDEPKSQCLMAEFAGENPTFRIVPGISRVSHADRITKKIRFSKEDRLRYLKQKGYL